MKLQELITIDNRYQDSVNIRLDMQNNEKLAQYIPTSASVAVLKQYLDNIEKNEENATMLIGPYGKGKSHLILVLLKLLWKEKDTIQQVQQLIQRVKKIDMWAAMQMMTIYENYKPYLPVVITYGNEDLNTTYLYALIRALKMAGIENVIPESGYQKAVDAILGWKENYPDVYAAFDNVLRQGVTDKNGGNLNTKSNVYDGAEQLIERLKQHNKLAYQTFVEMYPNFTAGSTFHPMVEMQAMKVYEEVDRVLRQEYGYAGMFLVFDEFSKYIEMQDKRKNQLSGNMGVVQDMCELCAQKENQMHHIFVAHKSIKEYGDFLKRETINCFTGVEGRLKEVHFITSIKNNYELISSTICKKDEKWNEFLEKWKGFEELEEAYQLPAFYSIFSKEDFRRIVVEGCFPLRPVTAYLLLKISEQVGQNERSLFTFLAKKEPNSLTQYVNDREGDLEEKDKKTSYELVSPAVVFDYFSALFYKEQTLSHVHEEYRKAQYVLEQLEGKRGKEAELVDSKKKIVKALALILMIHIPEEMNADKKTLSIASGLPRELYEHSLQELEQENYIVWRNRLHCYQFKNQIGIDVEKEIAAIRNGLGRIHFEQELQTLSGFRYEFPKSYNHTHSMTRYFDYVFMNETAFLKIQPEFVEQLFTEHFSDGKMIALIPKEQEWGIGEMSDEVKKKVAELNQERIVVLEPIEPLKLYDSIQEYVAIRKYQEDIQERKDEEDKILLEELQVQLEDCLYEIINRIENVYMPYNGRCKLYYKDAVYESIEDRKAFNQLLSDICEGYYNYAPVIRHEMVNRRKISTPMRRARTKVIEAILNHRDTSLWEKGTAPEATMFRATLYRTGLMGNAYPLDASVSKVLEKITEFIKAAEQGRCSFGELYRVLQGKGYGIRPGVIPIYLAYRFSQLDDMPVVYMKGQEYELDAVLLNQINQNPKDYELYVETRTVEKEEFLKQLAEMWGSEANVSAYTKEVLNWFQTLSQFAMRGEYTTCKAAKDLCQYLLRNEVNPREFVYEVIPKLCHTENYGKCVAVMKKVKETIEQQLEDLIQRIMTVTKEAFGGTDKDSLGALLKDWYNFLRTEAFERVYASYETTFIKIVRDISVMKGDMITDYAIVNRFAKVLTDIYIEDWKEDTFYYYQQQLHAVITAFTERETEGFEGKREVSFTDGNGEQIHKYFDSDIDGSAEFLQNEILSVMEEFGESVETEQKVAVLMNMIEELLK